MGGWWMVADYSARRVGKGADMDVSNPLVMALIILAIIALALVILRKL